MNPVVNRWNLIRAFSSIWLAMTFVSLTITLGADLLGLGLLLSACGVSVGALAILKGNWLWASCSLLVGGIIFASSLILNVLSNNLSHVFSVLLLGYVMLLFGVELLNISCRYREIYCSLISNSEFKPHVVIFRMSLRDLYFRIARLGVILGTSYIVTLGSLLLGAEIATFAPRLSDIPFYLVAVSISFALLIVIKEESLG